MPDLQLNPDITHPRYSTNSNKKYPLKFQKNPLQPFHGPPVDLRYTEVRPYIVMIRTSDTTCSTAVQTFLNMK